MKSYCCSNLLRASALNFERLDVLRDSIRHPRKTLLYLEFAQCLCFQFRGSRCITGIAQTSEKKVIVARICSELPFSYTSISIHYGIHSDIRVKSYCRWIFLRASVLNLECVGILRDSIGHPSKKLFSFEFGQSFYFQFRVSRYITGLNQTSK